MTIRTIKSVHFMSEDELKAEIQQHEQSAQQMRNEIAVRARYTTEQRLADKIHTLKYPGHDCSYWYDTWNTVPITGCRADMLLIAQNLTEHYSMDTINAFLAFLFPQR